MKSSRWAADVLTQAANEWEHGEPFEANADAKSILGTVESVYAIVGDSHEDMGRTLTAIGTALSEWRSGKGPAEYPELLRTMAQCFRDV